MRTTIAPPPRGQTITTPHPVRLQSNQHAGDWHLRDKPHPDRQIGDRHVPDMPLPYERPPDARIPDASRSSSRPPDERRLFFSSRIRLVLATPSRDSQRIQSVAGPQGEHPQDLLPANPDLFGSQHHGEVLALVPAHGSPITTRHQREKGAASEKDRSPSRYRLACCARPLIPAVA